MLIENDHVEVKYPTKENEKRGFLGLVLSSGLILLMMITFIRTMFDNGLKSLTPSMINESYEGLTPNFSTILSIVVLIAGVLGPMVAQMTYPRIFKNEALACSVFLALALPFTALLLLVGDISYWLILGAASVIVFATSGAGLFTTSFIAARFNKWGKGATVAGLLNCLASLGIVATNLVFTALADSIGWKSTAVVWVILISVAFVLAIVTVPLWQKFRVNNHIQ
jgi:sugar phosphate permease